MFGHHKSNSGDNEEYNGEKTGSKELGKRVRKPEGQK